MEIIRNQKGNTLINILMSLLVTVMLGGMVTTLYIYGLDSFKIDTNYTKQQHKLVKAIQLLRKDIAEASNIEIKHTGGIGTPVESIIVTFPSGGAPKTWKFEANSLKCDVSGTTHVAVEELDSASKLNYVASSDRLILCIQPLANNSGKYQWKNIKNPIITEFSVKYKIITES